MNSIPTLPDVQQQGYDAMRAGRSLHTPTHPEGLTINPYPVGTAARINFNVGCIVAAFPKLQ